MKCPRCESSALEEHDRDGVTVDACRTCRGIWLDRGELERMIARTMRDLDELQRPAPEPERREPPLTLVRRERHDDGDRDRDRDERPDRDRDRDDRWRRDERYPKRRRSWLESLGDIFD